MIDWLLNRRIEIVFNPKPYDRWSWVGRKIALAPSAYFLWGYDISQDMNVLALRIGATTCPHGISAWAFDFTLERRGPPWKWPRVRHDWTGEAVSNAKHAAWVEKWQAERKAKAA